MFFLVLGLGIAWLTSVTGWITVVEAIITATIPGLLLLLGTWTRVPDLAVVVVAVAAAVLFAALGARASRERSRAGAPGGRDLPAAGRP